MARNGKKRTLEVSYFCRKMGYTNDYVLNPPSWEEKCEIAYLAGWPEPFPSDDTI